MSICASTLRCHVSLDDWTKPIAMLSPDESHHLLHVLRGRVGQSVEIFNGIGGSGTAEISSMTRRQVAVKILTRSQATPRMFQITLIQALPREQKMDLIVQKATELGAARIRPVLAERSVVHLKKNQAEEKKGRWDKIALNACKQSNALWLPEIDPTRLLSEVITEKGVYDLLLLGALTPNARPLRDVLHDDHNRLLNSSKNKALSIGVVIGPEGDFSEGETENILAAGAVPVSLGPRILRAETAALFVLSVLQYEFLSG